jgi:putative transposase
MRRLPSDACGEIVYHVLNRANARMSIFEKPEAFLVIQITLQEFVDRTDMRLRAYCLMPTPWHLVVWPKKDSEFSHFTGWLILTYKQRWHADRHGAGTCPAKRGSPYGDKMSYSFDQKTRAGKRSPPSRQAEEGPRWFLTPSFG